MRIPISLTISLLISSCATQKLVARNADFIIDHQITKRIPLNSVQKEVFSRDVKRFLNAEKKEISRAIPLINKLEEDPARLTALYNEFSKIYQNIAFDFSKLVCDHLVELDKTQQKKFFDILREENNKISKVKHQTNLELIESRFEDITGEITKPQKSIINYYKVYFHERSKLRIQNRERLAMRLEEIFAMNLTRKEKEEHLIDAFKQYQDESFKGLRHDEILEKILPTLSTQQKSNLKLKARDLKSILTYYLETDY